MATEKKNGLPPLKQEITAIIFLALAVFIFLSAVFPQTTGKIGFWVVNKMLRAAFGWGIFFLPVVFLFFSLSLFFDREISKLRGHLLGVGLLFFVFLLLAETLYPAAGQIFNEIIVSSGGLTGYGVFWFLKSIIGPTGVWITIVALGIIGAMMTSNLSFNMIFSFVGELFEERPSRKEKKKAVKEKEAPEAEADEEDEEKETKADEKVAASARIIEARNQINSGAGAIDLKEEKPVKGEQAELPLDAGAEAPPKEKKVKVKIPKEVSSLDDYKLPPLTLLSGEAKTNKTSRPKTSLTFDAKILEDTLASFGVRAKVINISRGPAVTRFELQPEPGIKVSQIVRLSDDIALNLAAPGIRIETPIPGKSALGIEVPNQVTTNVHVLDIIKAPAFQDEKLKLLVALGKDIGGQPVIADLTQMPHMLIAGSTGSGKSVCLNALITSILMRARPDEVKFLMIDPKMVELVQYQDIPHLLAPVVTDSKKAAATLRDWVIVEMERRYSVFNLAGVRNIASYSDKRNKFLKGEFELTPVQSTENENLFQEKLPYIVVIIDELADLMMVASSEVERTICRIAQMARATGIHLVISTQRPSVDVITGVIKANIPSRISFAVFSQIDSRTILDSPGAEKLLGKGDMLFLPIGAMKPLRIQGAYISDKEIEDIAEYVKAQAKPEYSQEILNIKAELGKGGNGNGANDQDEFYEQAAELVRTSRWTSTSFLQRKLKIGYNRAARIMDQLETSGVIGPYEGENKPRRVLS